MLPLDGRSLAMIGGVAAAVIAGIYVIWGPSENRPVKRNRRGYLLLLIIDVTNVYLFMIILLIAFKKNNSRNTTQSTTL